MRALSGSDDVTLCEFLLTVEANSEVAEYITLYLGASPEVGWLPHERHLLLLLSVSDRLCRPALISFSCGALARQRCPHASLPCPGGSANDRMDC